MSLYRSMDRAALDAAYNNSAAVADSAQYIEDWQRRSAVLRARLSAHLDIAYGTAPRARLDFFSCGVAGAPVLLFFHGGYWQRNAKEGFAFIAEGPLAHGMHVALAGYTLAPEARLDQIVGEARAALRWLHHGVAALGGDPARIFVSGWSAGGHLAAMLMGETAARGGLALSGIYDLEPVRLNYLNEKLGLDEAEARRNSPLLHLPAQAGPLIVAVGAEELPELRRQSREFAAAWHAHGLAGEFRELPGCHHYSALEQFAHPEGVLAKAAVALAAAAA
jgi:arylformamidase